MEVSEPARQPRGSGLTPESLDALLRFLDADRERAAHQYEAIRQRLMRLFEWRGFDCPEDLADETFNRVARRLLEGVKVETAERYGYFCGVAHLLSKETARRNAREHTALEQGEWPPFSPVEELEADDRLACLRHCLDRLSKDQRLLVLRYHQEDDHIRSRQALSQELGIPMNALRIRVHRIRRKLEDCVRACLRKSSGRARQ